MGQADIYDFLKENKGKWFRQSEIYDAFPDVSDGSIANALKRLAKSRMVNFEIRKTKINNSTYKVRYYKYLEDVEDG